MVGHLIKDFRQRAGLSQLELELEIGASTGTISRFESNKVNPTKETILKLVEILGLNAYDAAQLFEIDINKDSNILIEISRKLEKLLEIKDLLNIITSELISVLGVVSSAIFLWDEDSVSLRIASYKIPNIDLAKVEKLMPMKISEFPNIENIEKFNNNLLLKSITELKTFETNKLEDFTEPLLPKTIVKTIQTIMGIKLLVALPLRLDNKRLGVLALVWRKEFLLPGDIFMLEYFVNQVSKSLYNSLKYDELNQKYKELLIKSR